MDTGLPLSPADLALGRALVARRRLTSEVLREVARARAPGESLAHALVARGLLVAAELEGPGGAGDLASGEAAPGAPAPGATRWDAGQTLAPPAPAAGDLASASRTAWDAGRTAAPPGAPTGPRPAADATRWEGASGPDDRTQVDPPLAGAEGRGAAALDATRAPAADRTRWEGPAAPTAAVPADQTYMTWDGPGGPAPAGAPGAGAGAPAPGAADPGAVSLARDYELLGELGRGGMGVVYRARERSSGREVAVKMILAHAAGLTAIERFLREGEVTAGLRHPNVVAVHAAGAHEGNPFLVFELVEGARTLAEAARGLDLRARVGYVRDAARALGVAHARGVVHRDVKPANLLVDARGTLKVADFGLAAGVALERLTQTGAQLGTPAFMAPEQVDGDRAAQGPPTDVWALGVVLYELLTERRPFVGATFAELALQIAKADPPAPRALAPATPRDLEAVCLRCLAVEPAARYPHGEALARDLERFLAGEPVLAPRRGRGRARWAAVALALGGLAAGAAWGIAPSADGGERALSRVRDAVAEARRARGDASLGGLRAEAAALEAAGAAAAAVPAARAAEARALLDEGGGEARRQVVYASLVARLLEAPAAGGPSGELAAEAVAAARRLVAVDAGPRARLLLARALAASPDGAPEGLALAVALAAGGGDDDGAEVRGAAGALLVAGHRPAEAARALGDAPPELRALRGRAHLAAGALDAAAADLEAAAGGPGAGADLELALDRAALALARGDAAAGLALLERLRQARHLGRWHALRGQALAALGRPGGAREALDEAARLDPAWRGARARLLLEQGRARSALEVLASVADPAANLDRAWAAWTLGGPDEALAPVIEAAVEAARGGRAPAALAARAHAAAAWAALARGDPADAERASAAAREAGPGEPAALAVAGELALRAGDAAALAAALAGLEAADAPWSPADGSAPAWADARRRAAAALRSRAARLAPPDAPGAGAPAGPEPTSPAPIEAADRALAAARASGRAAEVAAAAEAALAARLGPPGVRPWPTPCPSLGAPWLASEVAAALGAEARRLAARALVAEDGDALARLRRAASRALALDPGHADAAVWLARAEGADDPARALPALARLVEARDDLALPRRARVAWVDACRLEPALHRADVEALLARGRASPDDVLGLVASLIDAEERDAAWALVGALEPAALRDRPHTLGVIAALGEGRPGGEALARLAEDVTAALGRAFHILNDAWVRGDRGYLEQVARALPRNDRFLSWLAAFELAHSQDVLAGHGALAGYLLLSGPKRPNCVHAARHVPALGQSLQDDVLVASDAAIAAAPADPAPRLAAASLRMMVARGLALAVGGAAARPGQAMGAERALDEAERAADRALAAVALAPTSAGAAAFAADLLAETGALADAADLLATAEAIDAAWRDEARGWRLRRLELGPRLVSWAERLRGRDSLLAFVAARLAAARGDVEGAARHLAAIHRNTGDVIDDDDPRNSSGYTLVQDPLLGRHAARMEEALDPARRR